jgi:hypothetical protein
MKRIGIVMLVLSACLVSAAQVQTQKAHKVYKINVPGAGNSQGQGTIPFGILADDWIIGSYIDSSNVNHGFLRNPKTHHFTKFSYPGSLSTYPDGVNSKLAVTGSYWDTSTVGHGFLRAPGGHYTSFDDPGAGTGAGQGTFAGNINTKGEIAGNYRDSNGVSHGFLLSKVGGQYTTVDAPGAGTGSGQGTFIAGFSGLTDGGAVAGSYTDSNGVYHGFLRTGSGKFIDPIDPPGSVNSFVIGLSFKNVVGGYYVDSSGFYHGFVFRAPGTYVSFDAKNAFNTGANNMDPAGAIAGVYYDSGGVMHGYVRDPGLQGHLHEFDISGAGKGSGQGTSANSNNSSGAITGNIVDSNGVNHGFLRQ